MNEFIFEKSSPRTFKKRILLQSFYATTVLPLKLYVSDILGEIDWINYLVCMSISDWTKLVHFDVIEF